MNKESIPPSIHPIKRFVGLTRSQVDSILQQISKLKAGVIGDGCLDIYWHADMTRSELSRETAHYPLPIIKEQYSPGAAGNVAANLKALGCSSVYYCSVFGDDWRGSLLRQSISQRGIDVSFSLQSDNWITPAYCKPIRYGYQQSHQEDPRLDFHNHAPLPEEAMASLTDRLDQMAAEVDVIAVTDQLSHGIIGPSIRERLRYWSEQGKIIVVDSRDRIGLFHGIITKPNEVEAVRWTHSDKDAANGSWEQWLDSARKLTRHTRSPCCMTLGGNGSIWVDDSECIWTASRQVSPPLDIVGAGDCFGSAFLCALGTGCSGEEAMAFAHLAASIVVTKIGTTGTASPQEIRGLERG